MAYRMTPTCADVLARAYYGLDLTRGENRWRNASVTCCMRNGLITEDLQITEQGLYDLRRALSNPDKWIRP